MPTDRAEPLAPGAVRVRAPASSANLGPGFDALAVAVDAAMLTVDVVERGAQRVVAEGEGAEELPDDDTNLIWRALVAYCEWAGVDVPDVSLHARNEIPLERGMGSSSAAAVAGAALGRALTLGPGGSHDIVRLAGEFEGHLDNAAAATLGGLVLCTPTRLMRLEPTELLRPVLFVPASRQSTTAARGILPADLPLADAATNAARAAAVVAGLCGAVAWEPGDMVDLLHEPARLAAMAGSGEIVRSLRGMGVAACLSGAGPSVLAVLPLGGGHDAVSAVAPDGWRVLAAHWDLAGVRIEQGGTSR